MAIDFTITPLAVLSAVVTWNLEPTGDYGAFVVPEPMQLDVALLEFDTSGVEVQFSPGAPTTFSVFLEYPCANGVTLTILTDDSFVFSPSNVLTFGPGSQIASVTVTPASNAVLQTTTMVTFKVGGPDSSYYVVPASSSFSFEGGLVGVSIYPALSEFDLYPGDSFNQVVYLSFPVVNGLSITPTCPQIMFTPSTHTFSPGDTTATFAVTALHPYPLAVVKYVLSGPDAALYKALTDSGAVKQIAWATYPDFKDTIMVGAVSQEYSLVAAAPPVTSLTVTPSGPGITFNPPQFTFTPSVIAVAFTVVASHPQIEEEGIPITYAFSGPDAGNFYPIATSYVLALPQKLQADPAEFQTLTVGVASQTFPMYIEYPLSDLIVTPQAAGVVFTPASLVIGPNSPMAIFTMFPTTWGYEQMATFVVVPSPTDPTDSAWFDFSDLPSFYFDVDQRTVNAPLQIAYPDVYAGVESFPVPFSLTAPPLNSVTFTPFALDAVFTPASIVFTSTSGLYKTFTYHANGEGEHDVSWIVSGPDASMYVVPASTTFSVLLRDIFVMGAPENSFPVGTSFLLSVSIPTAPRGNLVITPLGAATFSPASVTITSANENPIIKVTPNNLGANDIWLSVTGSDAALYSSPEAISITTTPLTFGGADRTILGNWLGTHYPLLGLWSGKSVITARPPNDVTLIPSSPYLVFNPPVLVFNSSSTSQPLQFAFASRMISGDQCISFTVGGTDAAWYTAPDTLILNGALTTPAYSLQITSGPTVNAIAGVQSDPIGIFAANVAPESSITITPYTIGSSNLVFSPVSVILTHSSPKAYFTLTPLAGEGPVSVAFAISGPGAELFSAENMDYVTVTTSARPLRIQYSTLSDLEPLVPSGSNSVILTHAPTGTLTLRPVCESGVLTFNPAVLTFSSNQLVGYFTVTGLRPTDSEPFYYELSGTDASLYIFPEDQHASVGAYEIGFDNEYYTLFTNQPTVMRVWLSSPPAADVSITLSAAGVTFTPAVVVITAPSVVAEVVAVAHQDGLYQVPITWSVSGMDAGLYYFVDSYISTRANGVSFDGCFRTMQWIMNVPQACSVFLNNPATEDITFTVTSDLVSFPQGNTMFIPKGHDSATIVAVGTAPGTTLLAISSSSLAIAIPSPSEIQVFRPYIYAQNGEWAGTVGEVSQPLLFGVRAADGTNIPTPSNFTVRWLVSPPGSIVVNPAVQVVSYPATSFSVTVQPTFVLDGTITMVLSGPDASLFIPDPSNMNADNNAVIVAVTGLQRTFIPPTMYDSTMSASGGTPTFVVGVPSQPITLSAMTASSQISLHLSGTGLSFNPSVLRYTGTVESLTFTVTATAAVGATSVFFVITGADAGLFVAPEPINVMAIHNIVIPPLPSLQVGIPSNLLTVTVLSNITEPIVLAAYLNDEVATYITFQPSILLFSPEKNTATFRMIGNSVMQNLGEGVNPTTPDRNYQINQATINLYFYYKAAATSNAKVDEWIAISPPGYNTENWAVSIIPGSFTVTYSHLSIGATGTVTITANPPPRANVLLTPIGNNLNFFPSTATFTPSATTVTLQVSAVHADFAASEDIPFEVQYVISGANLYDYVPPTNSFLAVARGNAVSANDLVLGAGAAVAPAAALAAVAAVGALLL